MAEGLVVPLLGPVVTAAVSRVVTELSNIRNLKDKMACLTRNVNHLKSLQLDLLTELTQKESSIRGQERTSEVKLWLKYVENEKKDFEKLERDVLRRKFYKLWSKSRLAKRIVQRAVEVVRLIQLRKDFTHLVLEGKAEQLPLMTPSSKGRAFQHNFDKVLAYVMDDKVSSIGIYGMGGVGKTTLAEEVYNLLLKVPRFADHMHFITVSQEYNIVKLQKQISKDISDEDDEKKRARILTAVLKKQKDFVLILDDVWNGFDAEKFGVPLGYGKLIITSRLEQVCRQMGCKDVINVDVLSEEESWELFQKKFVLELEPEVTEIAQKVAKKCGGLPLAIIAISGSMIGKTDIHQWKNVHDELEKCYTYEKMENDVLPILQCSFNRLGDAILQNCFLYCSLYPEDYEIRKDKLVRILIREELMKKKDSRRAYFDQGYTILSQLENACLLVGVRNYGGDECVKMHDLIREMALWIRRKKPKYMVKSGMQLKEVPSEDEWTEDLDKVSLMENDLSNFPTDISPACPSLTSLNLCFDVSMTSIPEYFFLHMKSLLTLDLSYTDLERLPDSLCNIVTLKALILSHCMKLVSLPSLESLKALKELDLSGTHIQKVVHGLESLINLDCLEFECISLKMMPSGTLCKLLHLQRLTLVFDEFVNLEEVMRLRHLEEFKGAFANMDEFRQFIISRNCRGNQPTSYFVYVGKYSLSYISKTEHVRGAIITDTNLGEIAIDDEIIFPLWDLQTLHIQKAKNTKCVLRIMSNNKPTQFSALERLEELFLSELPKLRGIIEWAAGALTTTPPGTFSSLKKLCLEDIHGMKRLLPWCLLENLRNLELVEVIHCDQLEEIIGETEGDENMATTSNHPVAKLPNLRTLHLTFLPKLLRICKSTIICNSIETIEIRSCQKLNKVPLFLPLLNGKPSPPPTLKKIQLPTEDLEWWNSLEWDNPDHKSVPQPFLCSDYLWTITSE